VKAWFLRRFVDEMQASAMLLLHLFHRTNSSAKVCELREFLLNRLQPLVSLAVIDLSLYVISVLTPVPLV